MQCNISACIYVHTSNARRRIISHGMQMNNYWNHETKQWIIHSFRYTNIQNVYQYMEYLCSRISNTLLFFPLQPIHHSLHYKIQAELVLYWSYCYVWLFVSVCILSIIIITCYYPVCVSLFLWFVCVCVCVCAFLHVCVGYLYEANCDTNLRAENQRPHRKLGLDPVRINSHEFIPNFSQQ